MENRELFRQAALMDIFVAGGFWAIILSWTAWKRSWVGDDPT